MDTSLSILPNEQTLLTRRGVDALSGIDSKLSVIPEETEEEAYKRKTDLYSKALQSLTPEILV